MSLQVRQPLRPPTHRGFTHHSTRLSWACGRCRAWATVGPAPGRCPPAARWGWAAGCPPGSSPPAERAAVGAAGRSHAGGSGSGRAPTSMGVRRMPAVGERGSVTCARCLLRGAAGVAGALPEAPMAAAAALSPCPAGCAVRISRAPGGAAAHWPLHGGRAQPAAPISPHRQPAGSALPARHVPPRPPVNLRGRTRPLAPLYAVIGRGARHCLPRWPKGGCDWASRRVGTGSAASSRATDWLGPA